MNSATLLQLDAECPKLREVYAINLKIGMFRLKLIQ